MNLTWLLRATTTLFSLTLLLHFSAFSQEYTTSGTFTPPVGVTSVVVECWGAGGGGGQTTNNNKGGGGGAGGSYSRATVAVSSANTYTVTVGAGGTSTVSAGYSAFVLSGTDLVKAVGGVVGTSTGAGNNAGGGVGSTTGNVGNPAFFFAGGNGSASADAGGSARSGAGGGGAGTSGNGGNAASTTSPGVGASYGGGNGAVGVQGNSVGDDGNNYGGGGSGGFRNSGNTKVGGRGGNGAVRVSYITSFSPVAGCITSATVVTITGSGFSGATSVTFNGVSVPFTVNNNLQITATAPIGTTAGPIVVTAAAGFNLTSSTSFSIGSSFSPGTVTASLPPTSCKGTGMIVTVNASTAPDGAYTVTYNSIPGGTNLTASLNLTAGTGTFTTIPLTANSASILVTAISNGCPVAINASTGSTTGLDQPSTAGLSMTASTADIGNPVGSTISIRSKNLTAGTTYIVSYTVVGINGNSYPATIGTANVTMANQAKGNTKLGTFTTGQLVTAGQYRITINSIAFQSTGCATAATTTTTFTIQTGFFTQGSGTWNTPSVWGGAGTGPNYLDGPITISAGHVVTMPDTIALNSTWTLDQLVINGTLIIESGMKLIIVNGTAPESDITIINQGNIQVSGTLQFDPGVTHFGTTSSNVTFNASSKYRHGATTTEGSPPSASWNATSIFEVYGYTSFADNFASTQWSQNFGDVVWNCPSQASSINMNSLLGNGSIKGSFRIKSTGASILRFADSNNYTLTIPDSLSVINSARFATGPTSGNGPDIVSNIGTIYYASSASSWLCDAGQNNLTAGNIMVSSGVLFASSNAGNITKSGTTINLNGDFTVATGATFDASDTNNDRQGLLRFTNSPSNGAKTHLFTVDGAISGRMLYVIQTDQTVRAVRESAFISTANNVPAFTMASTAKVIVESTATNGAIQAGTVGGNIRTTQRLFAPDAIIEYGRTSPSKQYIGSGHPIDAGVDCIINNSAGVDVSTIGAPVIGGNLSVIAGNLTVAANNLSVAETTSLTGGNILLNGTAASGRTLILTGDLTMAGFNVQLTSGAGETQNANLILNGDYAGTSNFLFSGNNCNVSLGAGNAGSYSRNFPTGSNLTLETLTINRPTATVTIPTPWTVTLGNNLNTTGLFLNNGTLKMNGALTVSRTARLVGTSVLDFQGQTVTLRDSIASGPTSVFTSNAASSMIIDGTSPGIFNVLYFSAGNTLGTLTLNRSANVTPHVTLQTPLTIQTALNLTDGEFYTLAALTMSDNSTITRTPDASFTALSGVPGGQYYNLIYNNLVGTSLSSAQEAQGNLRNVTSNLTGTASLSTPINGIELLTVNSGTFTCATFPVSMGSFVNHSTFNAPAATTFTLTGNFTNNANYNHLAGTVIFNGISTVGGSTTTNFYHVTLINSSTLTFPAVAGVAGDIDFQTNSTFNHSNGNVILNGSLNQNVDASNAVGTQTLTETDLTAPLKAKFHTITVNKTGGEVFLLDDLQLGFLLDIQSGTKFNSDGRLILLSQTESTKWDGRIGPLTTVGAEVSGNVTAQRFMQNAGIVNRYIGVPLQDVAVSQFQDDFSITGEFVGSSFTDIATWGPCTGCSSLNPRSMRRYIESVAGPLANGYAGYPLANNAQTLERGRGYLVWMVNPINVRWDITNAINSGDIPLPVTYTQTSGGLNNDGWNLVANPYPSPIVWDKPANGNWVRTNIDPVASVPDLGSSSAYPTYYKVWNYNDDTGSLSDATDWGNGVLPGGVIATGQAFWVHASGAAPALTIKETAKSNSAQGVFYRETAKYRSEQLVIALSDGKVYDESFLKLNPEATDSYDRLFDGYKRKNEEMDVYFMDNEGRDLVMHTLADITESKKIPVAVEVVKPGEYTISFRNNDKFRYGMDLYLVDMQEQQSVNVAGAQYSFIATEGKTIMKDRFYLSRTPIYSETASAYSNVYPNPTRDKINITTDKDVNLVLMDSNGKVLQEQVSSGKNQLDLSHYASGIYILRIIDRTGAVLVRKIVKN
jgi:hypothetical protein